MDDKENLLTGEERELRKTVPKHVNEVTEGKPLGLLRRLLKEAGFADRGVGTITRRSLSVTGVELNSLCIPRSIVQRNSPLRGLITRLYGLASTWCAWIPD